MLLMLECARHRSFAAAGQALGLNHSTVSRRITALEKALGAPVFERSTTGCSLTRFGESILENCRRVESAVQEVTAIASSPDSRTTMSGVVRIAATDGFGTYVLTPVLAALQREHPGLEVELVTSVRMNPYSIGYDIEIGIGEPLVSRPGAHPFVSYDLAWYAAPSYLKDSPEPSVITDLAHHPLVYYVEAARLVDELVVMSRFAAAKRVKFASTNVHAQLEATRAGAGIGLLPAFMAEGTPGLVRVLPHERLTRNFHYSVAEQSMVRPAAVHVMRELLVRVRAERSRLQVPS